MGMVQDAEFPVTVGMLPLEPPLSEVGSDNVPTVTLVGPGIVRDLERDVEVLWC